MKSESQIRADQAELWEKYQIVSLNIPRGDVVMDTPKVGTHFYIPGEFAKVTEPGEWKFGWIKYPATDRFQILTIHRRNLLAILAGKIRITNLPPEAAITAIADDFRRYAICLRVSHPSFEVVADGMEARCFLAEFEAILPSE